MARENMNRSSVLRRERAFRFFMGDRYDWEKGEQARDIILGSTADWPGFREFTFSGVKSCFISSLEGTAISLRRDWLTCRRMAAEFVGYERLTVTVTNRFVVICEGAWTTVRRSLNVVHN